MRPEVELPIVSSATSDRFHARIVSWQRTHGRSRLPWQNTRDPYRVWLSEVMLQQTQVSTVLGYFERFLHRFPTVGALAAGSEDEVLGLWSGLGYYSRARNMHRCAQDIVERFGGEFPRTAAQLETLPGIGRSTAAAIAAFCFGEQVAILDGNVKRVLTRVLGFGGDLSQAKQVNALWDRATSLLPHADDPVAIASYTQGLMDLGATICLPRKPTCLLCPVNDACAAVRDGDPERFPVKSRKLKRSAQSLWLLHARDEGGRVWLEKRPSTGIWAGLHGLPLFDSLDALIAAVGSSAIRPTTEEPVFMHVLTHKDLHLHPVVALCAENSRLGAVGRWFTAAEWPSLGLPTPMRKLLEAAPGSPAAA